MVQWPEVAAEEGKNKKKITSNSPKRAGREGPAIAHPGATAGMIYPPPNPSGRADNPPLHGMVQRPEVAVVEAK